jgi:hypothetical protein
LGETYSSSSSIVLLHAGVGGEFGEDGGRELDGVADLYCGLGLRHILEHLGGGLLTFRALVLVVRVDGEFGADEADGEDRFGDDVGADVADDRAVGDGAADRNVKVCVRADGTERELVVLELTLYRDGSGAEVGVLCGEGAGDDIEGKRGVEGDGNASDGPGKLGNAVALRSMLRWTTSSRLTMEYL